MKKRIIVLSLITVILIAVIVFIALFFSGKVSVNWKSSESKEENLDYTEEEWTSPILEDEEYVYYVEKDSIRKIKKDTLGYDIIYESENSIEIDGMTLSGDNVYFIEYNSVRGVSDTFDVNIQKINKSGKENAQTLTHRQVKVPRSVIAISATSKAIYYADENAIYKFDIESEAEQVLVQSEFVPESNFVVNDDESIYFYKNSKFYRAFNGKVEQISTNKGFSGKQFLKQGDKVFLCNGYIGNYGIRDKLEYCDLNNNEIVTVEDEKTGLIYNHGNSLYMLGSDGVIYKLKNKKWEEYSRPSNSIGVSIDTKIKMTGDILMTHTNIGSVEKIYNLKENFFYEPGKIQERFLTKDSYLLNKIQSTEKLKYRDRNYKKGTFAYELDSSNNIRFGDIGDKKIYQIGDLDVFCTIDEMSNLLNNDKIIKVSKPEICGDYCYWVVDAATPDKHYITIFKKKFDNLSPLEVMDKKDGESFVSWAYHEGITGILTSSSVYLLDYNNQKISLLYMFKIGGKMANMTTKRSGYAYLDDEDAIITCTRFLDKELLVYNPINGRFYASAYDGSYTEREVFSRSYGKYISLALKVDMGYKDNVEFEGDFLKIGSDKVNLTTGESIYGENTPQKLLNNQ